MRRDDLWDNPQTDWRILAYEQRTNFYSESSLDTLLKRRVQPAAQPEVRPVPVQPPDKETA